LISSAALSVTFNSTVGVATADIFLLSPQKFGPAEANPYINIIINPCLAESQIVSTSSQYYSDERRSLNYAYIFQVSFGEQFAGLEFFTRECRRCPRRALPKELPRAAELYPGPSRNAWHSRGISKY
jgi:hypothetical protein